MTSSSFWATFDIWRHVCFTHIPKKRPSILLHSKSAKTLCDLCSPCCHSNWVVARDFAQCPRDCPENWNHGVLSSRNWTACRAMQRSLLLRHRGELDITQHPETVDLKIARVISDNIYVYIIIYIYIWLYVRRSKLNSCGEVMASLHKAPYRYTQSQHPFHQLGKIAARRGGSRWGIGFFFPLRWYLREIQTFTWSPRLTSTASARRLDTSRTHCRSSDLGGCPWLVLACLGLSCLCCLVSGAFFSSPRLLCNLIPRQNESAKPWPNESFKN